MAKARQQYFADEVSLFKEARTISFDEELLRKINEIDERAQENVIEIVKVNWEPLPVDSEKAVDVTVPLVIDALDSIDWQNALSAKQWKVLYDLILNLQSRGRFLSNWNCVTWLPVTAPFGTSYNYNPWDYYVVGVVDASTNYRPDWATYDGTASSVTESETVEVGDMYAYDGTQWLLLKNSARQIAVDAALSTTSTNPVENRVITNELNNKQNRLTAWANIQIDASTNTISATDTTYPNLPEAEGGVDVSLVTTWDKYIWNRKQNWLTAWANIQINPTTNVISATDTQYPNLPAAEGGIDVSLVTTWDKYRWDSKQQALTAWANITIENGVISSTDTTYTAGEWINIDEHNVISATITGIEWWHITWTLSDQTDLQTALNAKQNVLTPWDNITIQNNVISAANTTYAAWNGIQISNEIISNTAMFSPANVWTEGQYLKKTSSGYRWEDWGGSGWADVSNAAYGPTWDGQTSTAPSQNAVYDKINAMDIVIAWKQNILTAWENIQIIGDVISATDTKYKASDFDIKDLADVTGLRAYWNNKQDKILDLDAIRAWAAKWMTALQPGLVDNVSELINDAGYLTKAASDLINYYTKNETYNKTEIQNLISNLGGYEVVSVLPATWDARTIYLLWPSAWGTYEEYIYTNNQWVKIGDTTMDLTNYFHKVNDDSDDVREWTTHLFMTPAERTKLAWLQNETRTTIMNKLWAANSTRSGYLTSTDWNIFNEKQDKLVAWDNITIRWNVISASCSGWTDYEAWDWIRIRNDVISNTKPFSPSNSWNVDQVLTKTAGWYMWADAQGWGWWGWGGWNFNPANAWKSWQILTKTSSWYEWQDEEMNVRAWQINSQSGAGLTQETMQEIVTFLATNSDWNECAILKDVGKKDTFIYNHYENTGGVYKFRFVWTKRYTEENYTSPHGNYTSWWSYIIDIYMQNVGWTLTYDRRRTKDDDDLTVTNYLSCVGHHYQNPFIPSNPGDPATKAYVDSQVASGWSGMWITSNNTWTNIRVLQEWAWTQAQYDAIQHLDWVIYNIIG